MSITKFNTPEVKTYLVIWNADKSKFISFTQVDTHQRFASKHSNIDYYTDKEEWKTVLKNNNVDISDL